MTITITVVALATSAAGLLTLTAAAIAGHDPITWVADFCRAQFGADRSPDWAVGELTGGRHHLGVAPGSRAQKTRWESDTETFQAIGDDMISEVA